MAERELIIVEDAKGNTFQMTPKDAQTAGYTRVPAAQAAPAEVPNKKRQTSGGAKRGSKAAEQHLEEDSEGGDQGSEVDEQGEGGETPA